MATDLLFMGAQVRKPREPRGGGGGGCMLAGCQFDYSLAFASCGTCAELWSENSASPALLHDLLRLQRGGGGGGEWRGPLYVCQRPSMPNDLKVPPVVGDMGANKPPPMQEAAVKIVESSAGSQKLGKDRASLPAHHQGDCERII